MTRQCGSCTLCCKLVPVAEALNKPAFQRCVHQRSGKGCAIYAKRPLSCRHWDCAWLSDDRTANLSRPDRAHYVIDQEIDFITLRDDETGQESIKLPVAQVWLDPLYPDAHKDPALRAYLDALGLSALIRTSDRKGFVLVPPSVNSQRVWLEKHTDMVAEHEHGAFERMKVLHDLGVQTR